MPRKVDHEERRATIADALVRSAARTGLHAVTMRGVAAEAGMSLRLVQYYFGTKAELLLGALESLERRSTDRWAARLRCAPEDTTRAFLETFLAEALPTDEPSRAFHLLWTSYALLSVTDDELRAHPFLDGPNRREAELAGVLRTAVAAGELPIDRDPEVEAARLLTLAHGLGTSVLVGQRSVADAELVLRAHLDELFGDGSG